MPATSPAAEHLRPVGPARGARIYWPMNEPRRARSDDRGGGHQRAERWRRHDGRRTPASPGVSGRHRRRHGGIAERQRLEPGLRQRPAEMPPGHLHHPGLDRRTSTTSGGRIFGFGDLQIRELRATGTGSICMDNVGQARTSGSAPRTTTTHRLTSGTNLQRQPVAHGDRDHELRRDARSTSTESRRPAAPTPPGRGRTSATGGVAGDTFTGGRPRVSELASSRHGSGGSTSSPCTREPSAPGPDPGAVRRCARPAGVAATSRRRRPSRRRASGLVGPVQRRRLQRPRRLHHRLRVDFGDGTTGTGVAASRTYAAAGTYTVTLTVTDNGGSTGTTSTRRSPSQRQGWSPATGLQPDGGRMAGVRRRPAEPWTPTTAASNFAVTTASGGPGRCGWPPRQRPVRLPVLHVGPDVDDRRRR